MNKKNKILIIDDEIDMLNSCCKIFSVYGYNAIPVQEADIAINMINRENFDLILCDLLMPEKDGMDILNEVKKIGSKTPVIIFSAYGTIDRAVECMKEGAFDFIQKPFESDHLRVIVNKALEFNKLNRERQNLLEQLEDKYRFENIIGKSQKMFEIFEMIESVAQSDANVLITGESGTGKELIARSIHTRSKRKLNPFIPINCGAFPENLFEAEIFGHEKGAFTDATQKKIGLLEYSNTGTFFLDEVCEFPLNLQTKLLRVLQERQLRRVGGNEYINVDTRLISATNKNLKKMMAEGKLREDFYYRINVININIPPLRERKEDINLLAEHFLNKYAVKMNKRISGFNKEVIEKFEAYNWPGNIRELENIVERAVTLSKNEDIGMNDLPLQLKTQRNNHPSYDNISLKQAKIKALEEVEQNYLHYLLIKYCGNVTKAAEEAGMTRRNIYRLLTQYKIDPNDWREE